MEPTDQEIIDYLLGDIDESIQLRMEESLFSGDELFARISLIENRLIDLYVLDKLSDSERQTFEKKYLISDRRSQTAADSRHFIGLLNSFPTRRESRRAGKWSWLRSLFGSHSTALQLALASLLLVISIGFVWLLFERIQLKNRNTAAEASLRQKDEELRRLGANNDRAAEERAALERRHEELNRNEEALRRREEELRALEAGATSKSSSRASIITFVLSSTMRSGSEGSELQLASSHKVVHLVAYLKANNAERYRASLQRVSGEEVWNETLPKPRLELKRLTLKIPATVFKDRDYFVKIEGLTPSGERTLAAEFALTVRKR
jgi:hypothetical protein